MQSTKQEILNKIKSVEETIEFMENNNVVPSWEIDMYIDGYNEQLYSLNKQLKEVSEPKGTGIHGSNIADLQEIAEMEDWG